jgi:phosphoglycolate phosphatase-like HAD superfamily hydrolase
VPKPEIIRALVCDCDGVLLDSFLPSAERHRSIAQKHGFRVPSLLECAENLGGNWEKDFVPAIWPDQAEEYIAMYMAEVKLIGELVYPTFPGLPERLVKWSSRIPVCMVTNRDRSGALRKLELAHIDHSRFCFIQGVDDTPYRKPDPRVLEPVWKYLQTLGIKRKSEVTYTGDTLLDFRATSDFGFQFIGVASFPTAREKFLGAGVTPDRIVNSPIEIDKFIF